MDNQKALMIYLRLSEKNYPKAALKLGWMFENSIGGKKDDVNAFKFYKLAASRGENEAYLYMANLSLNKINANSILEAIGYASIAKDKKVKGSIKFLEKLMKLVEDRNLSELEVITLGLEFEIKKLNPN
jgi:TPR repeat protein